MQMINCVWRGAAEQSSTGAKEQEGSVDKDAVEMFYSDGF